MCHHQRGVLLQMRATKELQSPHRRIFILWSKLLFILIPPPQQTGNLESALHRRAEQLQCRCGVANQVGIINCTYVNDIVLGIMCICTTHVQPVALFHFLDNSNVVPAIEQLQNRELRINNAEISFPASEYPLYCFTSIHQSVRLSIYPSNCPPLIRCPN